MAEEQDAIVKVGVQWKSEPDNNGTEQLYNANEGAEKKAYVLHYLAEKGIKFDSDTVDKMIESAVLTLHHELYGGNNGTEN